jgi:hypothetical protein
MLLHHPVPVLRTETVPPKVGGTIVPRSLLVRSLTKTNNHTDVKPRLHQEGSSRRSRREGGGLDETCASSAGREHQLIKVLLITLSQTLILDEQELIEDIYLISGTD